MAKEGCLQSRRFINVSFPNFEVLAGWNKLIRLDLFYTKANTVQTEQKTASTPLSPSTSLSTIGSFPHFEVLARRNRNVFVALLPTKPLYLYFLYNTERHSPKNFLAVNCSLVANKYDHAGQISNISVSHSHLIYSNNLRDCGFVLKAGDLHSSTKSHLSLLIHNALAIHLPLNQFCD